MLTQGEILRSRYRVIRQLGRGGMGAVYEAHDNVFDASVALKEVVANISSAYNTKAREMVQLAFEREAKILAKVNHENIPHVKDYFAENDSQFLVMELVDGENLGKLLSERKSAFSVAEIIKWTDRLLDALDYLHTLNPPIIHRDIKPQNLQITSRQKIKLLDFGIAKGTESVSANTVSNQTFTAATLNYSPLEQMLRVLDPTFLAVMTHKYEKQIENILAQNADVRSDLFALGATMYHLATNVSPAEAVKRAIEIWDGKSDPLENPSKLNPEISVEFSSFLLKSMEIEREKRFDSADEMRKALHQIVKENARPTFGKTVEMKSEEVQSQETLPAIALPPNSQKTEMFDSPASVKTAGYDEAKLPATEVFEDVGSPADSPFVSNANQLSDTARSPKLEAFSEQPFAGGRKDLTANLQPIAQKKRQKIWLVPAVALFLLIIFGGAFGFWFLRNQPDEGQPNTNTSTNTLETNTAREETNSNNQMTEAVGQQGVGLPETVGEELDKDESKTEDARTPEKSASKVAPNPPTPRPTEVAKPQIQKQTPKKKATPKPKSLNCIFTDDCK